MNLIDNIIDKIIVYFEASKNFKVNQYDENTTYVDIEEVKDMHFITFNKETDTYKYILNFIQNGDFIKYQLDVTNENNMKKAITNSIKLIEDAEEYKKYADELQEMLTTL